MLLYISTGVNEALFSDFLEEQGIYTGIIQYDEYPSIRSALMAERAMPTYNYVFFNFTELPLPVDDIFTSIEYIRRYHHARIIVFAPEDVSTFDFFGELSDMGLRELVPVSGETDVFEELKECLSHSGKEFSNISALTASAHIEAVQDYVRPRLVIPPDCRLTIGIAGTQNRIGVTTQAFRIYHALKAMGATPCIVDIRQSFVAKLTKLYSNETVIDGSLLEIRGITFSHDIQVDTGHNVFIYDLGVSTDDDAPIYNACDIRFLCAGAKAWEFPLLVKPLNTTLKAAQQIIFSFVSQEDEKEAISLLAGRIPGNFAPWHPGLWNLSGTEWHENLLLPLLKEVIQK